MKKEVIIYKESAIQSLISDLGTFVMFVGLFAVNHFWFDDARWSGFVFTVLLTLSIISRGLSTKNKFTDKKAAIKYLQNL